MLTTTYTVADFSHFCQGFIQRFLRKLVIGTQQQDVIEHELVHAFISTTVNERLDSVFPEARNDVVLRVSSND